MGDDQAPEVPPLLIDQDMKLMDWMAVAPVMCHLIDSRGLLVSVSDVWLRKLGYDRQDVIGQMASRFLTRGPPETAGAGDPEVRTGMVENLEYQMICKSGEMIDILLSEVRAEGRLGSEAVAIAVITDVTRMKAMERRLAESEVRYRHLVEHQSEMVSLAKVDGELIFVNHAYANQYGMTPDDMLGRNLLDFVPPDVRDDLVAHFRRVALIGEATDIENQIVSPDGTARWMSWTNKALKDENGVVTTIHSVGKDVHMRVDAENRVKQSEARYRLLAENSADMVFQLDGDRVFRYVSPACMDILGYTLEELSGKSLDPLVHAGDHARLYAIFEAFAAGRLSRHTEIQQFLHRKGHGVWVEMQLRTITGCQEEEGFAIVGTLRDYTVRKQMEDQLRDANSRLTQIAATDGLTGLLNRRALDEVLARELEKARTQRGDLGLILADVDWFKAFNDRYGHLAGDECLQRVSRILSSVAGEFGHMVARYGGEEFCIVLPGCDEEATFLMAERLRLSVLDAGISHAESPLGVATVSLGVASFVLSGASTCADLIDAADRALYQAKDEGRNAIVRASTSGAALPPSLLEA